MQLKWKIVLTMVLFIITTLSFAQNTLPQGIAYEKQSFQNHVVHVLVVDLLHYQLELVKAHNQVFGRETIKEIARRKNAIAAINGGFFEIGNNEDGRPSGTLIINKDIFALKRHVEGALLAWNDKNFHIGKTKVSLNVVYGEHILSPDKVNQFVKDEEVALYSHPWGPTSLTPYYRHEFLINEELRVINSIDHGDNPIPPRGWILSVPRSFPVSSIKVGEKIRLNLHFEHLKEEEDQNWHDFKHFMTGIPLLVKHGKPIPDLSRAGRKSFAEMPHARTALGMHKDGGIVMVVIEHSYNQSLNEITLEQAQNVLLEKGYSRLAMDKMRLEEIREILREHFSYSAVAGLNLPDLAKLMVDLGCESAVNLDGGGSASLFLNGHIVNTTIGDEDEAKGQKLLRPVSDAIVVIKR